MKIITSRRATLRIGLLFTLVAALILPALAADIQRVASVNVTLKYPDESVPAPFRVYAYSGVQSGSGVGTVKVGPPAWDSTVKYFTGDVTETERTTKGCRTIAEGSFGNAASRVSATARIVVEGGKVSAFVWKDTETGQTVFFDTKGLLAPKSGSITLFNTNNTVAQTTTY